MRISDFFISKRLKRIVLRKRRATKSSLLDLSDQEGGASAAPSWKAQLRGRAHEIVLETDLDGGFWHERTVRTRVY